MTRLEQYAGHWFLHSGIIDTGGNASGGVARYYRAAERANAPVSTEITGYTVSALLYLHRQAKARGEDSAPYLSAALKSARFLLNDAWDSASSTYPFEPASDRAYFFDLGIIARGLMAAWRVTEDDAFLERVKEAALSLAFDFLGEDGFYPVIALPEKQPLPEEPRWSRKPGCFQLKAAVIWREIEEAQAQHLFDMALAYSLATHESFLEQDPSTDDGRARLMDRLHAYCYFLEGLLWATEHQAARDALAQGLQRATSLYREIAPQFERSDVPAQLLRVRLIAQHMGLVPLDAEAAAHEAARAQSFQVVEGAAAADPRLAGGFWFGRKGSEMLPFANPVSTAFCTQALLLWQQHTAGSWDFSLQDLI